MLQDRVGEVIKVFMFNEMHSRLMVYVVRSADTYKFYSGHGFPVVIDCLSPIDPEIRVSSNFLREVQKNLGPYLNNPSSIEFAKSCSNIYSPYIPLNVEISKLWGGLRKSYKPLLNKTAKHFICSVAEPTENLIRETYNLHCHVSGRPTRTWQSWLEMFNSCRNDEGFALIITDKLSSQLVGFSFFHYLDKSALYSVGAYLRGDIYRDYGIGHLSLWTAVDVLRNYGVETLFLTTVDQSALTQKERGILNFFDGFTKEKKILTTIDALRSQ